MIFSTVIMEGLGSTESNSRFSFTSKLESQFLDLAPYDVMINEFLGNE